MKKLYFLSYFQYWMQEFSVDMLVLRGHILVKMFGHVPYNSGSLFLGWSWHEYFSNGNKESEKEEWDWSDPINRM